MTEDREESVVLRMAKQQVSEGRDGLMVQGKAETTSDRGQRGISGSENGQDNK